MPLIIAGNRAEAEHYIIYAKDTGMQWRYICLPDELPKYGFGVVFLVGSYRERFNWQQLRELLYASSHRVVDEWGVLVRKTDLRCMK